MNPLQTPEIDRIRRNSRRSAILTAVGILILFGILGYSVWELNHLNAAIAGKREELRSLEESKATLQKEITRLENYGEILFKQYRNTAELSKQLQQETNLPPVRIRSEAPLEAVVVPKASAVKASDSPALYDFTLWLEVPKERRSDIARVSYFFNHPSFQDKVLESSDGNDSFRIKYRGWGALRRVIITMHLKDGSESKLAFDMADAINKAKSDLKVPVKGDSRIPTKGDGPVPVK